MKRTLLFGLICAIGLSACNNKKQVTNSDIGVAQAFIKDILENDFKEAETLVLKEETNKQYFDLFKKMLVSWKIIKTQKLLSMK